MARRTKTPTTNPKLAVAYLRVSTDKQDLGPEAQRASIEAWARREGVEVVAWCEDRGVSGAAPLEKRPGLLAALGALEAHAAGVLAVAKRDRLARDVMAAAMTERLVARAGGRIVSAAGEGSDSDDPASVLMRSMIDAFAQYERAMIAMRTKQALAAKKAKGERVGSVPTGFRLADDGKTLVPASHEAEAIALARELRAQGLTYRAIGAALDAKGFKPRGGTWHAKTILRALAA